MNMKVDGFPVVKRQFDLAGVQGLSPDAIKLHLDLYGGYFKEANALIAQLAELPKSLDPTATDKLVRDGLVRRLAFEHNGVIWYELFFEMLSGGGSAAKPDRGSAFAEALDLSFGGFDEWKRDVLALGATRGVGWVVTFHRGADNRLLNAWVDDHRQGLLAGLPALVVFDLWEHAYMLDFKPSERDKYLQEVFANISRRVIESRCESRRELFKG